MYTLSLDDILDEGSKFKYSMFISFPQFIYCSHDEVYFPKLSCLIAADGGTLHSKWAPSGLHRAFDELSFGEFAQVSSAFFGVKNLRKWSHDTWSYLDLLRSCMKQSVHAIHDLKDKNTVNKMQ